MSRLLVLLTLMIWSPLTAQGQEEKLHVLSISGGGARGAWGGGVVEALAQDRGIHYNRVIGTSTGSLMAPFIVAQRFEELKSYYTGVTQKSIFNVNPFKKDGSLIGLKAALRTLFGSHSLGESKNLRKLIRRAMPPDLYQEMVDKGIFYATAINFSTGDIYYHGSDRYNPAEIPLPDSTDRRAVRAYVKERDMRRQQMLDWIWASSNQPVFMSLYETREHEEAERKDYWVDGGVRENIPLVKGLDLILKQYPFGSDTLDVIINNTQSSGISEMKKPRVLNAMLQTIKILQFDVRSNDLNTASAANSPTHNSVLANVKQFDIKEREILPEDHICINLYFMSEETKKIHPNDLLFSKREMTNLWEEGNDYSQSSDPLFFVLTKDDARDIVETFQEDLDRIYGAEQEPIAGRFN